MIKIQKDSLKFPGNYRGVVLDNLDPDQLGRIKVGIFGVFDGISMADVPWAIPAAPIFTGAGVGHGSFSVPEIGSNVWCFFEAVDIYQPVYFAAAPDGIRGLPSERTSNYPSRSVIKTKNGIVIYVDDSSKEIKVNHPSGAFLKIDGSGNITITGTTVNINP